MHKGFTENTLDYVVTRGKESIVQPIVAVGGGKHKHMAPAFYGKCYYCHYSSHSQKLCPLRYCSICKQYGHFELACSQTRFFGSTPYMSAAPLRIRRETETKDMPASDITPSAKPAGAL
jgi:hypothetical protein